MPKWIDTAIAFTKNIKTTGALYQTSRRAEAALSQFVAPQTPQVIVELGAGHGNVTRAILGKMGVASTLHAFEINPEFCQVLRGIQDPRLHVVEASAAALATQVPGQVDLIISALPFTLMSNELTDAILGACKQALTPQGHMTQVVYSTFLLDAFRCHFPSVEYKLLWGVPPEFIYVAQALVTNSARLGTNNQG